MCHFYYHFFFKFYAGVLLASRRLSRFKYESAHSKIKSPAIAIQIESWFAHH